VELGEFAVAAVVAGRGDQLGGIRYEEFIRASIFHNICNVTAI